MHPDFLPLLCCPATGEELTLDAEATNEHGMVVTGKLTNRSGRAYPIIRGIPRFVSEELYAGSFGYEWTRWPRVQFESDNIGRPMAGHTTRMWETITNAPVERVRDKTIVEFGCGPGRFLDVIRRKGGIAVGLELSQAVEVARKNFAHDPKVLVVQGDIYHPPFRAKTMDGGYSIGVLHHTPEPPRGLQELVQCIKEKGWVSVCVYSKGDFYDYRSVDRFRRLHNKLAKKLGYHPALCYSYLAGYALAPGLRGFRRIPGLGRLIHYVERNWLVLLDLPDVRWRVLDVFDAITPVIASTHTAAEVSQWLEASNCKEIRPVPWGTTSFSAVRA